MSPQAAAPTTPSLEDYQRLLEENHRLRSELEMLREELAYLRRQIFGQKRERFVPGDGQEVLPLGGPGPAVREPRETERITYERRLRKHHPVREDIPAHLPRDVVRIEPDFDTSDLEQIGQKVTEQLEYNPPSFRVTRLVRPVYAGTVNEERTVVCAEMPALCIPKGKAGPSLVSHILVSKLEDHTPLYRLRGEIKRDCGMNIPESSIGSWFSQGCTWLAIIARRLEELALACGYMQIDETPIKVMVQPTAGKSTQGYMWVRHAPELRIVVFSYFSSRNAQAAKDLTGAFQGICQSDGLNIYDQLNNKEGIVHVGCHGHARRGFEKSLGNDKTRAAFALKVFRILFAVEKRAAKKEMTPKERLALRQRHSGKAMDEFRRWLDREIFNVNPKSTIGKAMGYVDNRWKELTRFLEDGRIEISNNLIENRIRPLALGRRNWLFAGSPDGARQLAAGYTVMGTCKLLGINSFRYLCHVFRELPHRKAGDIDDLLPTNWKDPAPS